MKKTLSPKDRALGMGQNITRRDFVHGVGLAAVGAITAGRQAEAASAVAARGVPSGQVYYPPIQTGMRGMHPGSFELAHALTWQGGHWTDAIEPLDGDYDLVVVGAGISGLAAAWFYRQQHGASVRILVLDNHDEFGGHARRNEFHQGGDMRLAWGGAMNLEYSGYSEVALGLLKALGVDIKRLAKQTDFDFTHLGKLGTSTYFDADHFGRDVLLKGSRLRYSTQQENLELVEQMPLDAASRRSLLDFLGSDKDLFPTLDTAAKAALLHKLPYTEFLTRHAGLTTPAAELFMKVTDGYWGLSAWLLSTMECLESGLPGWHRLGAMGQALQSDLEPRYAMFPDGNASVARLLVRSLVPAVATGVDMDDICAAKFDYSKLDRSGSLVRLRLNSTALRVENAAGGQRQQVAVTYATGDKAFRVRARHCVLACFNTMVPYLCPQLPPAQKQALNYQTRIPLILTNVLMRNAQAMQKIGIASAYCPGRLHGNVFLTHGVRAKDYHPAWDPAEPAVCMFWGCMSADDRSLPVRDQIRAARASLLRMGFEDFEREIRTVLKGLLGPAGFDPARDILAITTNRWPHGYAYEYLDLHDPQWPPGKAPHELARKPLGAIAIANSDSGASAYLDSAVDQAWRAVNDLPA